MRAFWKALQEGVGTLLRRGNLAAARKELNAQGFAFLVQLGGGKLPA